MLKETFFLLVFLGTNNGIVLLGSIEEWRECLLVDSNFEPLVVLELHSLHTPSGADCIIVTSGTSWQRDDELAPSDGTKSGISISFLSPATTQLVSPTRSEMGREDCTNILAIILCTSICVFAVLLFFLDFLIGNAA